MGKRKSKAPPPKKVQPKLDTTFTCPFCNHEKSVSAKLDFQQYKGLVECSVCGQKYACTIDDLSAAIDVYSDWIDACERLNAPGGGGGGEDEEEFLKEEEEEEEDRRKEVRAADAADEELRKKKKKKQKTEGKRKDDEYEKDFIDSEEDEEEDFGDDSESD
jgi:transcription elongation factor Elf1